MFGGRKGISPAAMDGEWKGEGTDGMKGKFRFGVERSGEGLYIPGNAARLNAPRDNFCV